MMLRNVKAPTLDSERLLVLLCTLNKCHCRQPADEILLSCHARQECYQNIEFQRYAHSIRHLPSSACLHESEDNAYLVAVLELQLI